MKKKIAKEILFLAKILFAILIIWGMTIAFQSYRTPQLKSQINNKQAEIDSLKKIYFKRKLLYCLSEKELVGDIPIANPFIEKPEYEHKNIYGKIFKSTDIVTLEFALRQINETNPDYDIDIPEIEKYWDYSINNPEKSYPNLIRHWGGVYAKYLGIENTNDFVEYLKKNNLSNYKTMVELNNVLNILNEKITFWESFTVGLMLKYISIIIIGLTYVVRALIWAIKNAK